MKIYLAISLLLWLILYLQEKEKYWKILIEITIREECVPIC